MQHRFIGFGAFQVDTRARLLTRSGSVITLPAKAFDILVELVRTPGETVSKDHLMNAVWPGAFVEEGNLTQMIFLLRKALGDGNTGSPYIVTVPRQGYRFVGEVRLSFSEARGTVPRQRKLVAAAAFICSCALVTGLFLSIARPGDEVEIQRIAVLPFDDLSAGRDMDYFCQGLADELTEAVSRIPGVRVIARASASNFKKANSIGLAEAKLSVQAVLDGTVRRDGDQLRITAELLRARDGARIWAETYDAGTGDIFSVQASIARSVGEKLRRRVGDTPYTPVRYTSNVVLYDLYLKGRTGSPSLCQEAIKRDPQYAPAHSCLADAYAGMWTAGLDPSGALARARLAAEMALRLDDRLPEAHLTQAQILAASWDWNGALAETEKAIRLSPNFGPALWHRANLLLFTGREQEAERAFADAEAIDPMSPGMLTHKLQMLFATRRYDDTLAFAEQHRTDLASLYYSARAYAEKGRLTEAIRSYEEYRRRSSKKMHGFGALTGLYVRAGRRPEALKILDEVTRTARQTYVRPVAMAQLHLGLGAEDEALLWLEKAYAQPDSMLRFLRVDPCWDPIRHKPRFQALLRKINLQS